MLVRLFVSLIGFALLFTSAAEAMSGHCAKAAQQVALQPMQAHCADMADMQQPVQDESSDQTSGICCCMAMTAPLLLEMPGLEARAKPQTLWTRPVNVAGLSVPPKVAIPPPRI